MLERLNPILRIICILLAALLLLQISRSFARRSPKSAFDLSSRIAASAQNPGATPTNAPAALPPETQARIEKITQSGLLGPVVRPPPMALLGIAGPHVMLRAPNGQTGLIAEGEELGGVKLLRIGTNRILIEHEQQTKELMLFSGFGSETLLPKGKENSR